MKTDATVSTTSTTTTSGSVPVGTIVNFFGNAQSIPAGWFLCNGRQLTQDEKNKYPSLANLLEPFNYYLPNLGGRTIVGLGTIGDGSNFDFTQTGGEYTHKLSSEEMPSHQHFGWGEADTTSPYNWPGNLGFSNERKYFGSNKSDSDNYLYGSTYAGGVYSEVMGTTHGDAGVSQGDNLAHNNMQPYYVLSFMICAG